VIRGIAELMNLSTHTINGVIGWAQTRLGKQYLVNETLSGPNLIETRAPQAFGILTYSELASQANLVN